MTESRLRFEIGSLVVPGDRLGPARSEFAPGPGTYLRQGQLYASITGRLQKQPQKEEIVQDDDAAKQQQQQQKQRTILSVTSTKPFLQKAVLSVGQVVLAKVTRMALQHQAVLEIVATEHGPLRYTHEAVLRREDIWPKEQLLQLQSKGSNSDMLAFCPGDLVVARILSLGDTRRYVLTTAEPALGVIHAVSAKSGQPMVPSSWNEMQCPETGAKEARKCAKPKTVTAAGSAFKNEDAMSE